MKKIDLSIKELINYMQQNILEQRHNGIVLLYDKETLIKIYYKEVYDGYGCLNEQKIQAQIKNKMSALPDNYLKEKMYLLEKLGLVRGMIYCNNYLIGVLLTYYHDYITLTKRFEELSPISKLVVLNKIRDLLELVMAKKLYPYNIKEENILLAKDSLDVKLIDLDDKEAIYKNIGCTDHEAYYDCYKKYNEMCKRLIK